jgi:hypothetical protein
MKQNVGKTDRNIRLGVTGLLVVTGIFAQQPLLSLVGLVVLATSVTGFCLAYLPFKIDTNKEARG